MPEGSGVETRDLNVPLVGFVILVGAVLTFVLILGLEALYFSKERRELRIKAGGIPAELVEVRREQEHKLEGYRWVNRENGIVAIPIERAMELVVKESGRPTEASR